MQQTYLSARQQRLSAQVFNIASIIAVLAPPLIMLWIAASIFVYAAIAHHPNPRVVKYLRSAGYRFYGLAGSLVVVLNYSEQMKPWFGGTLHMWLAVWLISLLVIVPLGVRDIVRAAREPWAGLNLAAA